MTTAVGVPLKLSETSPDFASLVLQLQLFLESKGSWKDALASGTGQTLIEMMSAVGALNQFGIESAAREAFLVTAKRQSSIYAIARMLGVRIVRKSPANVSVNLSRLQTNTQQVIPRFTQFKVGNQLFYNRDPIVFPVGVVRVGKAHVYDDTQQDVRLYEGQIRQKLYNADTTQFREIYLEENGFIVADEDVQVVIRNVPLNINEIWGKTRNGNAIWTAEPGEKVWYDSTSGHGDTILTFGDGARGAIPPLGSIIEVTYAITQGSFGNLGSSGLGVAHSEDTTITGQTIEIVSGGSDQKAAMFYRQMAPHIFKARSRAVTIRDYQAISLHYPTVASASVSAQRSSAMRASSPRWMNVIQICLLPEKPDPTSGIDPTLDFTLSAGQKQDFLEYMEEFKHVAVYLDLVDAHKILVDLDITLHINKTASAGTVVSDVSDRIRELFARTYYTLGRKITQSDVVDTALIQDVDYVTINVMKESSQGTNTVSDLVPINPNVTHEDPSALQHLKSISAFLELNDTPQTFRVNVQYTDREE